MTRKYEDDAELVKQYKKAPEPVKTTAPVAPVKQPIGKATISADDNFTPEKAIKPVKTQTTVDKPIAEPKPITSPTETQPIGKSTIQADNDIVAQKKPVGQYSVATMTALERRIAEQDERDAKTRQQQALGELSVKLASTINPSNKERFYIDEKHYVVLDQADTVGYEAWLLRQQGYAKDTKNNYANVGDYAIKANRKAVYLDDKFKYGEYLDLSEIVKSGDQGAFQQWMTENGDRSLTYTERKVRDALQAMVNEGKYGLTAEDAEAVFAQFGKMEILDIEQGYFSISQSALDKIARVPGAVEKYNTLYQSGKTAEANRYLADLADGGALPLVVNATPLVNYFTTPLKVGKREQADTLDYLSYFADNAKNGFIDAFQSLGLELIPGAVNYLAKTVLDVTGSFVEDNNLDIIYDTARGDGPDIARDLANWVGDIAEGTEKTIRASEKDRNDRAIELATKWDLIIREGSAGVAFDVAGQSGYTIGQMTPTILTSALLSTPTGGTALALIAPTASASNIGLGVMFAGVASRTYADDIAMGYSYQDAGAHAILTGAVEVWTEKLFDPGRIMGMRFTKNVAGEAVQESLENAVRVMAGTPTYKALYNFAMDTFEEGAEEWIAEVVGAGLQNILDYGIASGKDPDNVYEFLADVASDMASVSVGDQSGQAVNSFLMGALTSGLMSGAQTATSYTKLDTWRTQITPVLEKFATATLDTVKTMGVINDYQMGRAQIRFTKQGSSSGNTENVKNEALSGDETFDGRHVIVRFNEADTTEEQINQRITEMKARGYVVDSSTGGMGEYDENTKTVYVSSYGLINKGTEEDPVYIVRKGSGNILQTVSHEIFHALSTTNPTVKKMMNDFYREFGYNDRYLNTKIAGLKYKKVDGKDVLLNPDPALTNGDTRPLIVGTIEHAMYAKRASSATYADPNVYTDELIINELSADFFGNIIAMRPDMVYKFYKQAMKKDLDISAFHKGVAKLFGVANHRLGDYTIVRKANKEINTIDRVKSAFQSSSTQEVAESNLFMDYLDRLVMASAQANNTETFAMDTLAMMDENVKDLTKAEIAVKKAYGADAVATRRRAIMDKATVKRLATRPETAPVAIINEYGRETQVEEGQSIRSVEGKTFFMGDDLTATQAEMLGNGVTVEQEQLGATLETARDLLVSVKRENADAVGQPSIVLTYHEQGRVNVAVSYVGDQQDFDQNIERLAGSKVIDAKTGNVVMSETTRVMRPSKITKTKEQEPQAFKDETPKARTSRDVYIQSSSIGQSVGSYTHLVKPGTPTAVYVDGVAQMATMMDEGKLSPTQIREQVKQIKAKPEPSVGDFNVESMDAEFMVGQINKALNAYLEYADVLEENEAEIEHRTRKQADPEDSDIFGKMFDDSKHPGYYSPLRNYLIGKLPESISVKDLRNLVSNQNKYEVNYFMTRLLKQDDATILNKKDILKELFVMEPQMWTEWEPSHRYSGYYFSQRNMGYLGIYASNPIWMDKYYSKGHFSSKGNFNGAIPGVHPVSHVLLSDVYDFYGKNGLLIEEHQSDTHQAFNNGSYVYADENFVDTVRPIWEAKATEKWDTIAQKIGEFIDGLGGQDIIYYPSYVGDSGFLYHVGDNVDLAKTITSIHGANNTRVAQFRRSTSDIAQEIKGLSYEQVLEAFMAKDESVLRDTNVRSEIKFDGNYKLMGLLQAQAFPKQYANLQEMMKDRYGIDLTIKVLASSNRELQQREGNYSELDPKIPYDQAVMIAGVVRFVVYTEHSDRVALANEIRATGYNVEYIDLPKESIKSYQTIENIYGELVDYLEESDEDFADDFLTYFGRENRGFINDIMRSIASGVDESTLIDSAIAESGYEPDRNKPRVRDLMYNTRHDAEGNEIRGFHPLSEYSSIAFNRTIKTDEETITGLDKRTTTKQEILVLSDHNVVDVDMMLMNTYSVNESRYEIVTEDLLLDDSNYFHIKGKARYVVDSFSINATYNNYALVRVRLKGKLIENQSTDEKFSAYVGFRGAKLPEEIFYAFVKLQDFDKMMDAYGNQTFETGKQELTNVYGDNITIERPTENRNELFKDYLAYDDVIYRDGKSYLQENHEPTSENQSLRNTFAPLEMLNVLESKNYNLENAFKVGQKVGAEQYAMARYYHANYKDKDSMLRPFPFMGDGWKRNNIHSALRHAVKNGYSRLYITNGLKPTEKYTRFDGSSGTIITGFQWFTAHVLKGDGGNESLPAEGFNSYRTSIENLKKRANEIQEKVDKSRPAQTKSYEETLDATIGRWAISEANLRLKDEPLSKQERGKKAEQLAQKIKAEVIADKGDRFNEFEQQAKDRYNEQNKPKYTPTEEEQIILDIADAKENGTYYKVYFDIKGKIKPDTVNAIGTRGIPMYLYDDGSFAKTGDTSKIAVFTKFTDFDTPEADLGYKAGSFFAQPENRLVFAESLKKTTFDMVGEFTADERAYMKPQAFYTYNFPGYYVLADRFSGMSYHYDKLSVAELRSIAEKTGATVGYELVTNNTKPVDYTSPNKIDEEKVLRKAQRIGLTEVLFPGTQKLLLTPFGSLETNINEDKLKRFAKKNEEVIGVMAYVNALDSIFNDQDEDYFSYMTPGDFYDYIMAKHHDWPSTRGIGAEPNDVVTPLMDFINLYDDITPETAHIHLPQALPYNYVNSGREWVIDRIGQEPQTMKKNLFDGYFYEYIKVIQAKSTAYYSIRNNLNDTIGPSMISAFKPVHYSTLLYELNNGNFANEQTMAFLGQEIARMVAPQDPDINAFIRYTLNQLNPRIADIKKNDASVLVTAVDGGLITKEQIEKINNPAIDRFDMVEGINNITIRDIMRRFKYNATGAFEGLTHPTNTESIFNMAGESVAPVDMLRELSAMMTFNVNDTGKFKVLGAPLFGPTRAMREVEASDVKHLVEKLNGDNGPHIYGEFIKSIRQNIALYRNRLGDLSHSLSATREFIKHLKKATQDFDMYLVTFYKQAFVEHVKAQGEDSEIFRDLFGDFVRFNVALTIHESNYDEFYKEERDWLVSMKTSLQELLSDMEPYYNGDANFDSVVKATMNVIEAIDENESQEKNDLSKAIKYRESIDDPTKYIGMLKAGFMRASFIEINDKVKEMFGPDAKTPLKQADLDDDDYRRMFYTDRFDLRGKVTQVMADIEKRTKVIKLSDMIDYLKSFKYSSAPGINGIVRDLEYKAGMGETTVSREAIEKALDQIKADYNQNKFSQVKSQVVDIFPSIKNTKDRVMARLLLDVIENDIELNEASYWSGLKDFLTTDKQRYVTFDDMSEYLSKVPEVSYVEVSKDSFARPMYGGVSSVSPQGRKLLDTTKDTVYKETFISSPKIYGEVRDLHFTNRKNLIAWERTVENAIDKNTNSKMFVLDEFQIPRFDSRRVDPDNAEDMAKAKADADVLNKVYNEARQYTIDTLNIPANALYRVNMGDYSYPAYAENINDYIEQEYPGYTVSKTTEITEDPRAYYQVYDLANGDGETMRIQVTQYKSHEALLEDADLKLTESEIYPGLELIPLEKANKELATEFPGETMTSAPGMLHKLIKLQDYMSMTAYPMPMADDVRYILLRTLKNRVAQVAKTDQRFLITSGVEQATRNSENNRPFFEGFAVTVGLLVEGSQLTVTLQTLTGRMDIGGRNFTVPVDRFINNKNKITDFAQSTTEVSALVELGHNLKTVLSIDEIRAIRDAVRLIKSGDQTIPKVFHIVRNATNYPVDAETMNSAIQAQAQAPKGYSPALNSLIAQNAYNRVAFNAGNEIMVEKMAEIIAGMDIEAVVGELHSIRFDGIANTYDVLIPQLIGDEFAQFGVEPHYTYVTRSDLPKLLKQAHGFIRANSAQHRNLSDLINSIDPQDVTGSLANYQKLLETAKKDGIKYGNALGRAILEYGVLAREMAYIGHELTRDDYMAHQYDVARKLNHGAFYLEIPMTPELKASARQFAIEPGRLAQADIQDGGATTKRQSTIAKINDVIKNKLQAKSIKRNGQPPIYPSSDVASAQNEIKTIISLSVANGDIFFEAPTQEYFDRMRPRDKTNALFIKDTQAFFDSLSRRDKKADVSAFDIPGRPIDYVLDAINEFDHPIKHNRALRQMQIHALNKIDPLRKEAVRIGAPYYMTIILSKNSLWGFQITDNGANIMNDLAIDPDFGGSLVVKQNVNGVEQTLYPGVIRQVGQRFNNVLKQHISAEMALDLIDLYTLTTTAWDDLSGNATYPTYPEIKGKKERAIRYRDAYKEAIEKVVKRDENGKIVVVDPSKTYTNENGELFIIFNHNSMKQADLEDELDATRRHQFTVMANAEIPKEVYGELEYRIESGEFRYSTASDAYAVEYARQIVLPDPEKAYQDFESAFRSNRRMTKRDIAIAEVLIVVLSDPETRVNNRTMKVIRLISDLATLGTELGQSVQALSLVQRLSPQGQLIHLRRTADRLERIYTDFGQPIKLSFDEDLVGQLMEGDPASIEIIVDQIKLDLASQLPATLADKLNAWRYLSMLGNPRTHLRNITGNLLMLPLIRTKDTVATILETILVPKSHRTKGFTASGDLIRWAKNDFEEYKETALGGGKYSTQGEIERNKRIFKLAWLENLRQFNFDMLELEDAVFSKIHYVHALANYMTARGLDPQTLPSDGVILEQARDYAMKEAQKATFRDANRMANILNNVQRQTKIGGFFLNAIIPFKKTPMNIIKRGFEYSPAGLIKTLTWNAYELKTKHISVTQFIDNISSGLTGTAVMMLGYYLFNLGWLDMGPDDDDPDRLKEFYRAIGVQKYAIKLDGYTYTIDWAVPAVLPLIVGAETARFMANGDMDRSLMNVLPDALINMFDPVFELSMLQSLTRTLQSYSGSETAMVGEAMISALESYVGQYIPTIVGQIARTVDPVTRSTYAPKDSDLNPVVERIGRSLMNKIPFLSQYNEPWVDVFGQEMTNNDTANWLESAVLNFLSIGYLRSTERTKEEDVVFDLYNDTLSTTVLPRIAPSSFSVDGGKINLTGEQKTEFAKTMGNLSSTYIKEFGRLAEYNKLNDEDKEDVVAKIYEYAYQSAKYDITKNADTWWAKADGAVEKGISPVDYFMAEVVYNKITATDTKTKEYAFIDELVKNARLTPDDIKYILITRGYKVSDADYAYIKAGKE